MTQTDQKSNTMPVIKNFAVFLGCAIGGLPLGGLFITFFVGLFSNTRLMHDQDTFFIYMEVFVGLVLLAGGLFRGMTKGTTGSFACSGLGLGMVFAGWFAKTISHLHM